MDDQDYYATLGLDRAATQEQIKRAYRKLARKYHPDVSKEADAEARFKDVAQAYEALNDPERRAAYDLAGRHRRSGRAFKAPPGWTGGFDSGGGQQGPAGPDSDAAFFETLFRRARGSGPSPREAGGDHHAKVSITLRDAYRGGHQNISLRTPTMDASGHVSLQDRTLDVNIPKGIRPGQHLRLAGQGGAAQDGEPAGDLYLEIMFAPHPHFRIDGRDVYLNLPVTPWEAALGARLAVPTPDGSVQLSVPPGSAAGSKLRLKGQGLPSVPPGDLYAVLAVSLPPADTPQAHDAYRAMAAAFDGFDPRHPLLEGTP